MTPQTDAAFAPPGERRKPAPFVIVVIAVSVFFLGWVFLTRGSAGTQTEAVGTATAQRNAQTVAYYGNGQLKVLNFYANPPEVKRGSRTLVCYGVSNAKTIKLEPPDMPVWPSPNRCADVSPKKSTTYTLTIANAAGTTKTQSLEIKVR